MVTDVECGKRPDSKHGKRAKGQVVVTFATAESLKLEIAKLAKKEGITPSEWMRTALRERARRSFAAMRRGAA
jgi:hypothetical protein